MQSLIQDKKFTDKKFCQREQMAKLAKIFSWQKFPPIRYYYYYYVKFLLCEVVGKYCKYNAVFSPAYLRHVSPTGLQYKYYFPLM